MNNTKYKKTYKPLLLWLIGFPIITIILVENFFNVSKKVSVLSTLIIVVISIYVLMLIVYKGEYVYWINGGPNYEEAKEAGSEKRKKYAKAHLDIFFKMMLISFLYGIISLLLVFSIWIDTLLILLLIIIAAFLTIPIKFNK